MKIGKKYETCIDITRRDLDFAMQREDYNSHQDFNMEITLRDETSRRKFLTVTIPGGALMSALHNRSQVPCVTEFEDGFRVFGKSKETKTVWIKEQPKLKYGEDPKLSKKLTDEGWEYSHGYGNHKTSEERDGVRHYSCQLLRFVDEPEEE